MKLSPSQREALARHLLSRFRLFVAEKTGLPMALVAKAFDLADLFGAGVPTGDDFVGRYWTTIGPVVSSDLISQALILIVVGSLGIVAWITYRFRDWKFGVTALVSLLHDVIVVVGAFAILGTFFNVEIDALFVTAMLTVIGFSVHDTIVVFDRLREHLNRGEKGTLGEIANRALTETMSRSINTSLSAIITLTALLIFGSSEIFYFILALVVGIVVGTYSSVGVATALLVWFYRPKSR